MTIELSAIPEIAAAFAPRRSRLYQGLTLGRDIAPADRLANAARINAALGQVAGGVLDFPPGEILEFESPLVIPGDVSIQGNNCRLVWRGPPLSTQFIRLNAPNLRVDIDRLILEGPTEAAVLAAGDCYTQAIIAAPNARLTLTRSRYDGWFGNAVVGSVGASLHLESCDLQAWQSHGAGGDGAHGWEVRHCRFHRVGSGRSTDHQLYINPDVGLYLEGCEFLRPEGAASNWAVHYYGSDEIPPYRTPIFRDCLFQRMVFTNEHAYTIVDNCTFQDTLLRVQNDTLIQGGRFVNSYLHHRTPLASHVRAVNLRADDSHLLCEVSNPDGVLYQFVNPDWRNVVVENRAWPLNQIEVRGGRWASGILDLSGAGVSAHLGAGLHLGAGWSTQLWNGATYSEGEVVHDP